MPIFLKESTASQEIPLGIFLDSTDGDTELTALTIANTDIRLWKNGATAFATKNAGGATHMSNGVYYAVLDEIDTNTLGSLVVTTHVSGALVTRLECAVLPANVYDSIIAGTDKLEVDNVQWLGAALGATNQNGVPVVDVTHVSGAAQNIATQASLTTVDGKADTLITRVPNVISLAAINAEVDTAISDASLATAASLATTDGKVDSVQSNVTSILADTNELQTDLMNGGRIDLILDAIKAVTDAIPNGGNLNNISVADVNAQVLDVLNTDTFAELSNIPAATTTISNMIRLIYSLSRNKIVTNDSTMTLRNDADNANIGTAPVSIVSGTLTREKLS